MMTKQLCCTRKLAWHKQDRHEEELHLVRQRYVIIIMLARLCARAAMSFTCVLGDKLLLTTTPRSFVCDTIGSAQLSRLRWGDDTCFPIFKMQHVSMEIASCHWQAHSAREFKAHCNSIRSTSLMIFIYILTPSANILTLTLCLSRTSISSFIS